MACKLHIAMTVHVTFNVHDVHEQFWPTLYTWLALL